MPLGIPSTDNWKGKKKKCLLQFPKQVQRFIFTGRQTPSKYILVFCALLKN